MNKFFILPLALVSLSTFAGNFNCVSKSTGLRYVTDIKSKTIRVLDKNKVISIEKFDRMTLVSFESLPAKNVYTFGNKYGAFMEVIERAGKIIGSFDDDENLVCAERN